MRLFIAVKVPGDVRDEIIRIQKEIDQKGLKLPRHDREEFHLTLKFLGEVDARYVESLKAKLSEIKFETFKLTLKGLDVFTPKRIRVVHISIKPLEQIAGLFEKIHKATNEFPIDHPFTAHITIARVRFLKDQEAFLNKVNQIDVKPIEFDVKAFYLFKSTLTEAGPIYEDMGEFPAKPL
ncbi:RNA 2',3'-cyclic phosphodiesterase [Candidatus Woesearchaeota archaeon]|nr:RNA 2',3'-cyclic phosphodiesterase [Candidatus Woesearchaeota archaeon]